MVHGRIETGAATDMLALVTANVRRASELIVRYGARAGTLNLMAIQNAAVASRWQEPAFAVAMLYNTPVALGGMRTTDAKREIPCHFAIDRTASASSKAVKFFAGAPGVKEAARDLVQALEMDSYYGRAASAIAAGIALKSALQSYGFRVRWVDYDILARMERVAGRYMHVAQSREYVLSKAAGLFNVLVEEDERWQGLKGVFRGLHPSWAGMMVSAAITPRSEVEKLVPQNDLAAAHLRASAKAFIRNPESTWFTEKVMRYMG